MGIGEDCPQARLLAPWSWRIGRHGHGSGVEAAQESTNEVKARREEKENPLSAPVSPLEPRGNGTRSGIDFPPCPPRLLHFAIEQEDTGGTARLLLKFVAQKIDERRMLATPYHLSNPFDRFGSAQELEP
jgi:hypothetical protein